MNEFLLITGMAIVTVLIRYPVLAMSGRLQLAPWFLQLLRFVPPTVLTAIVVPAVLMPNDQLWLDFTNARLIGAIAAVGIGVWRKNLLLTIVIGMLVFLIWQWLI
ncbi:AzlD domain-containing protein [Leptolyngbya sp. 7M]|uniref:AzlD domain-containing protein n=1 Tax=Leptolyngbya sp. 7M TaxID=2812896 RepID=UPI001B8D843B|nr:AzlD domain-containing protein [Leptolyngbya sp. 7M]QYO63429.1 AzlD domain-containing protein [Leptolyngbya sp. 7M]